MSDKKHLKAIISGKVQGVFFRAFVMKKARELDVCGQVKFLENGSLEVQAEAKENKLKEFEKLLSRGPRLARVRDVEVEYSQDIQGYDKFVIRR